MVERYPAVLLGGVAAVSGWLAHNRLLWSADALILLAATAAWLLWLGPPNRVSKVWRSPGRPELLAAGLADAALLAVRALPEGWSMLLPLVVGLGVFAWAAPVRSAVLPVVAAAAGLGWLLVLRSQPVRDIGAWVQVAAALGLAAWGGWRLLRTCLYRLRETWAWAVSVIVFVILAPVLVRWLRGLNPLDVAALLLVVTFGAVGVAAWRAAQERRRQAERELARPLQTLGEHVAAVLGWGGKANPLPAEHESWIVEHAWPEDPAASGAVITCRYVKGWQGSDAQLGQLCRQAAVCLGGSWTARVVPGERWVQLTREAAPFELPDRFPYDALGLSVDQVPIGVRADGSPVIADLTSESPHVLVSASTGWGKTSVLGVLVAHVAAGGGLVDICDPKRVGFTNFRGLPNVRLHVEVGDMIGAVAQFKAEMDERYRQLERGVSVEGLPLRLLVLDEMGSFRGQVRQRWTGKGQPPTFDQVQSILWQGRAARCHVVVAAQQANANVLGSSDCRDQFALRVAAGPQSAASSAMLFGNESLPEVTLRKGRAVVGVGAELTVVQLAFLDPRRAAEIAATGRGRFPAGDAAAPVAEPPAPATSSPRADPDPAGRTGADGGPGAAECGQQPTSAHVPRADARWSANVGSAPTSPPMTAMICSRCPHAWETRASAGQSIRCPSCGARRRVPKRAGS
jgi:DNA-directed RNA polymerase subunit RPC12/RpoP